MKYKSVIVTKRGGPEVLKIIENDLRPPFVTLLPSVATSYMLETLYSIVGQLLFKGISALTF